MGKKRLYKNVAFISACLVVTGLFGISASAQEMKNEVKQEQGKGTKVASNKRNVMYYGDWSIWGGEGQFYPKDIPADQLTHLNYAFMDFDANGELIFTDKDAACDAPVGMDGVTWGDPNGGLINAFKELKAKNPNLKIGISLGGWSKSGDFSVVAANKDKRANLIKNTLAFIKYAEMDFVDLDWEYPASVREADKVDNQNDEGTPNSRPEDKANYITLLQEFKTALNKQGAEIGKTYELSVALPAPKTKLDEGIDIAKLFDVVDFANIMTYDMRGAWDKASGHQTPLYTNPNDPEKGKGLSVDESVQYLISQGAKKEKIVVGAAYYTRGWEQVTNTGIDKNNPGLFGTAAVVNKDADQNPTPGAENEAPCKVGDGGRKGGVWAYRSHDKLKQKYPGLKEYWDDTAKAPYLYDEKSGAFFTYDNIKSIEAKVDYVKQNDLGGMIAWMASQDKPTSSTKRDELTNATKKALYGETALPKHEIVYDKLDLNVDINPYKESWSDKGGFEITLKNNEKLEEKGTVLQSVELGSETVKNGKIYIKTNGNKITGGDYSVGSITQEGDYAVIDLGKLYSGKLIKPGESYKMTVTTEKAPTDASSVEAIYLTQKISQTGPEIGTQLIYGKETAPGENTAPVLKGINDTEVFLGNTFDKMAGITASDKEDGDLTSKIKVTGTVDTSKLGEYTLTYTVEDREGLKAEQSRKVKVVEKPVVENKKPEIVGATDKTIKVGTNFNPLDGVTAKDPEDGDLTSKIKVDGTVDTSKEGVYKLTYSVKDSGGLGATAVRNITVEKEATPGIDTYDPNKIYNTGDKVIFKGKEYTAKWWVKGEDPDKSAAWQVTPDKGADGAEIYIPGKAYNGGDIVSYNGEKYKAKWWTTATPGINTSWEKI